MNPARRTFLGMLMAGIGAASALVAGQQIPPRKPPFPPGEEEEPSPKPDPRAILKENQKEIKKEVERLVELANELKKEVDKTDASEVLSLQVVKKAEEIERLAKHIKNLSRG